MKLKDWLITVIITGAFVLLAATLVPTRLKAVVGSVIGIAVFGLVLLAFREWHRRRESRANAEPPASPATMPPPSADMLRRTAEEITWGQDRYRAMSDWNATEGRAYLRLERRDVDVQSFEVIVNDSTNIEARSNVFGTGDKTVLVWYPDHIPLAPRPPIAGVYQVAWRALVDAGGQAEMREVGRDQFRIPHP